MFLVFSIAFLLFFFCVFVFVVDSVGVVVRIVFYCFDCIGVAVLFFYCFLWFLTAFAFCFGSV